MTILRTDPFNFTGKVATIQKSLDESRKAVGKIRKNLMKQCNIYYV